MHVRPTSVNGEDFVSTGYCFLRLDKIITHDNLIDVSFVSEAPLKRDL
jgi:hypothetical protein